VGSYKSAKYTCYLFWQYQPLISLYTPSNINQGE